MMSILDIKKTDAPFKAFSVKCMLFSKSDHLKNVGMFMLLQKSDNET